MKKAIVLGGTRGIGGAIAKSLDEIGLDVHAFSSKAVDTGNLEHIDVLVTNHPEVDVLVLNTGGPPAIDFFNIKKETWEKYHNQLFLGFCIKYYHHHYQKPLLLKIFGLHFLNNRDFSWIKGKSVL